ncbi:quaternary ammonium compound-resistance protein SugE [Nannocystis exedens]|uniref:Guanidinium exporter n=1 Tax=Nannocystis exedens TaxID=54 RepID=A0A1I1VSK7_9BACT|nr:multidrug efflux SMR transporter [Nannocystis exedens]PCC72793.1 multidrug transporter [Nannocystis exedens]SFD85814.1 quaternary ammonium compound-resistance protein SugE [Nannocystis exedens]
MSTAWMYLVVAGLLEVGWALGLKWSDGFDVRNKPVATILTVVALIASFALLAQASKSLPIGTAYAVWTGIGAAGAAVGGMLLLGEPVAPLRVLFLTMLVVAIVGLKFSAGDA